MKNLTILTDNEEWEINNKLRFIQIQEPANTIRVKFEGSMTIDDFNRYLEKCQALIGQRVGFRADNVITASMVLNEIKSDYSILSIYFKGEDIEWN